MKVNSDPFEYAVHRITESGGTLPVWAILHEDTYETSFGDGFYLHVAGIALTEEAAHRLAELAPTGGWDKWHVRPYHIGLVRGRIAFLERLKQEEEFTVDKFVEILNEISKLALASPLCVGTAGRKLGPFVSLAI